MTFIAQYWAGLLERQREAILERNKSTQVLSKEAPFGTYARLRLTHTETVRGQVSGEGYS